MPWMHGLLRMIKVIMRKCGTLRSRPINRYFALCPLIVRREISRFSTPLLDH